MICTWYLALLLLVIFQNCITILKYHLWWLVTNITTNHSITYTKCYGLRRRHFSLLGICLLNIVVNRVSAERGQSNCAFNNWGFLSQQWKFTCARILHPDCLSLTPFTFRFLCLIVRPWDCSKNRETWEVWSIILLAVFSTRKMESRRALVSLQDLPCVQSHNTTLFYRVVSILRNGNHIILHFWYFSS